WRAPRRAEGRGGSAVAQGRVNARFSVRPLSSRRYPAVGSGCYSPRRVTGFGGIGKNGFLGTLALLGHLRAGACGVGGADAVVPVRSDRGGRLRRGGRDATRLELDGAASGVRRRVAPDRRAVASAGAAVLLARFGRGA